MPARFRTQTHSNAATERTIILDTLYGLPSQRATADRIIALNGNRLDRTTCLDTLRLLIGDGLVVKHDGIYELTSRGQGYTSGIKSITSRA